MERTIREIGSDSRPEQGVVGKARAVLQGRYHAATEAASAMAAPVLRHRIVATFNAEAAGNTRDGIIRTLRDYLVTGDEPMVGEALRDAFHAARQDRRGRDCRARGSRRTRR